MAPKAQRAHMMAGVKGTGTVVFMRGTGSLTIRLDAILSVELDVDYANIQWMGGGNLSISNPEGHRLLEALGWRISSEAPRVNHEPRPGPEFVDRTGNGVPR